MKKRFITAILGVIMLLSVVVVSASADQNMYFTDQAQADQAVMALGLEVPPGEDGMNFVSRTIYTAEEALEAGALEGDISGLGYVIIDIYESDPVTVDYPG